MPPWAPGRLPDRVKLPTPPPARAAALAAAVSLGALAGGGVYTLSYAEGLS
jgi:hypothetical protein